jgi:hypothetical protein
MGGDKIRVFERAFFLVGHRGHVAGENLNAAGGAGGYAAAAMENRDSGVFDSQNELLASRNLVGSVAFDSEFGHGASVQSTWLMRYLEPRDFRLDALLRRPLPAGRWGEENFVRLTLPSAEEPVGSAEGIWRPSHTSRFGLADGGLQLTEDSFTATDGTQVSVVSLRNAGEHALDVAVGFSWETTLPVRIAPPGDDLLQRLEANGRLQFVFTAAESRERAEAWASERSPVRRQVEALEGWLHAHAPRLDCSDPAPMQAFYTGWYARWREQDTVSGDDETLMALLGPSRSGSELTLRPALSEMVRFCLADWRVNGSRITVVWDDPGTPGDAYDDGLKGLVLWKDGKRIHQQENLEPLTVAVS